MQGVHFAPAPYCFRCPIGHTYPACKRGGETLACIDALEHLIRTLGPDSIAAVVAEPIFGVGMFHPPAEYLQPAARADARARDPLDRRRGDDGLRPDGQALRLPALPRRHARPDGASGKGMVSAALPAGGARHEPRDRASHGRLPLGDGQHVRGPPGRRRRDRAPTSSGSSRSGVAERAAALGEHMGMRLARARGYAIRVSPRSPARASSGRSSSSVPTAPASASSPTTATRSPPARRSSRPPSSSPASAPSAASRSRRRRRTRSGSDLR